MSRAFNFLLLCIPIVASACLPLPNRRSLASMVIADKTGMSTLVSTDGSSCEVSERVFQDTQIGSSRTCVWKRRDGTVDTRRGGRIPRPARAPRIGGA